VVAARATRAEVGTAGKDGEVEEDEEVMAAGAGGAGGEREGRKEGGSEDSFDEIAFCSHGDRHTHMPRLCFVR